MLFGIIYFLLRSHFQNFHDASDALAFSLGTLTTLGDPSGTMHLAE